MLWYKVKETGQGTNNEEHKTFHKDQAVKSYHTEKKRVFLTFDLLLSATHFVR